MESAATITSTMIQPIVTTVADNAKVLIPVGIGVMAIMIGASLIPRIVYKFL